MSYIVKFTKILRIMLNIKKKFNLVGLLITSSLVYLKI
jgi:hypothetical protein